MKPSDHDFNTPASTKKMYGADKYNASSFTTATGYMDDAAVDMSTRLFKKGVQAAKLKELNEDPKYSVWHPRYCIVI